MPSTAKTLAGAAGVIATLVVAYLLLRAPEAPSPGPRGTEAPSATSVRTAPPEPVASVAPRAVVPPSATTITSGQPVELGSALTQTKKVAAVRAALAAGDHRLALREIEEYEKFPEPRVLREEVTVLKIQTLPHVGRRTDALALALSTRDDPTFAPYQVQIDAIVTDAGLLPAQ